MADEQRLKDARIKLVIDTSEAERALGGMRREPDRGKEKEREREREKDRKKPERPSGVVVAGIPGALGQAIKAFAAAYVLKIVTEMVPAMIDKRISQQDEATKWLLETLLGPIRDALRWTDRRFHDIEAFTAIYGAGRGAALDLARSQQLLLGATDSGSVMDIARREGALASIEARQEAARRVAGRAAAGGAIVDLADELKAQLFGGAIR